MAAKNLHALAWTIASLIVLILLIDQLFWKPLATVADRYKLELSAGEERKRPAGESMALGEAASFPL